MIIESRANERVKEARKLQNRKERKESGLHLIESGKLVREAIALPARRSSPASSRTGLILQCRTAR